MFARALAVTALVSVVVSLPACGPKEWAPPTAGDTQDDPAKVRAGYGNSELHAWFPLTPPEIDALKGIGAAKAGDPHALLALAIAASGDKRDAATYAAYAKRLDGVVAELRPTIEKADDYHKGYELNRALHRIFFTGAKHGKLGAYELDQNRLTGIFERGTYNCISSAMLYVLLARSFDLPVRGVVVPTHAFVEYGPPGGKILEVETTSETGFDWVHDARYFKEGAADWSADRGLRPVTLEDYQARKIMDPLAFVGETFADEANRARSAQGDRKDEAGRLWELAGIVSPDDELIAEGRVWSLVSEAKDLSDRKAWRTLAKMSDIVGPGLESVGDTWAKQEKVAANLLWLRYTFARALETVHRPDDAVALADAQFERIDPAWKDANELRTGFVGILGNVMTEHLEKGEFAAGLAAIAKRLDLCVADTGFCRGNLSVLFGNWSIAAQNEGDWQAARQHLQECLKTIPDDPKCKSALGDLESRHQF